MSKGLDESQAAKEQHKTDDSISHNDIVFNVFICYSIMILVISGVRYLRRTS